jgi:hypothetical protein
LFVHILFGGLVLLVEIINDLYIINAFAYFGKGIGPVFFLFDLAQDLFGFFGIVPEIRCVGALFEFAYLVGLLVEVKDASLTLPCGLSNRGSGR